MTATEKTRKYWAGSNITGCQTCFTPIEKVFYDGRTLSGVWGIMCPTCWTFGPGVGVCGIGFGQKYEKQGDGRWLKTEG